MTAKVFPTWLFPSPTHTGLNRVISEGSLLLGVVSFVFLCVWGTGGSGYTWPGRSFLFLSFAIPEGGWRIYTQCPGHQIGMSGWCSQMAGFRA